MNTLQHSTFAYSQQKGWCCSEPPQQPSAVETQFTQGVHVATPTTCSAVETLPLGHQPHPEGLHNGHLLSVRQRSSFRRPRVDHCIDIPQNGNCALTLDLYTLVFILKGSSSRPHGGEAPSPPCTPPSCPFDGSPSWRGVACRVAATWHACIGWLCLRHC